MSAVVAEAVTVAPYRPEWQPHFERLNRAWIERFFVVEESDLTEMRNPETRFLAQGGQIFFILEGETVVGTCAIAPDPKHPEEYHLSKMAVDESVRGRGYGDRLIEVALTFAREAGAHTVTLVSNTVLTPAIRLYRKHGFQEVSLDPDEEYERANIKMRRVFGEAREDA